MDIGKQNILSYKKPKLEALEVEEWGGTVYLRSMSASDRDAYESETYRFKGSELTLNRENATARLLVRCLCDKEGNRLFADSEAVELGKQDYWLLKRLLSVAMKLNGFSADEVETIAKN